MSVLAYLNEKGNASAKVRDNLKEQVGALLDNRLEDVGVEDTARGTKVITLGTDESTDQPVYAEISVVITMKDPSEKAKPRKAKEKVETETVVPNLFG